MKWNEIKSNCLLEASFFWVWVSNLSRETINIKLNYKKFLFTFRTFCRYTFLSNLDAPETIIFSFEDFFGFSTFFLEMRQFEQLRHNLTMVKNGRFSKPLIRAFIYRKEGTKRFKRLVLTICNVFQIRWQRRLCTAVFLRHKCQQFYVPDKTININDIFRINCFSNSKISAILRSLNSVITLF